MLVDDQVNDQGFQARPVAGRGCGHSSRQLPNVLPAAPAPDPPHLMLGHPDRDFGQVVHLMRAFHAHVHGGGQLRAARAAACRTVLLGLIRLRYPPQPATLGTSLLAPAPPDPTILAPPALRLITARRTSSLDGGNDEFCELREIVRSSHATRRANSTFSARSAAISRSRAAHAPHPAAGDGRSDTSNHDHDTPATIKPTR
jgi:hypothetical protein